MFSLETILTDLTPAMIKFRKRPNVGPRGAFMDVARMEFKEAFSIRQAETSWDSEDPTQDMRDLASIFASFVWHEVASIEKLSSAEFGELLMQRLPEARIEAETEAAEIVKRREWWKRKL